jgi:pyruvyl transferase EpsI
MKIWFGPERIGCLNNLRMYEQGYKENKNAFSRLSKSRKCFLLSTANYGNLGDLAIAEAEVQLLRDHFDGEVIEIPYGSLWEYAKVIDRFFEPDDLLCLHGGGNMGDVYPLYEFERSSILSLFPNYRTIVMPQTISYTESGKSLLEMTKRIYSKHTNLQLFAREEISWREMKLQYPELDVQLVPDIVLNLDIRGYKIPQCQRSGITALLRNDIEKRTNNDDFSKIHTAVNQMQKKLSVADTVVEEKAPIHQRERHFFIEQILTEIYSSQMVITDRLHGMVFAALTQTPCVVLPNNNHKVFGVYKWLENIPSIRFAHTPEEAIAFISELDETYFDEDSFYTRDKLQNKFTSLIRALR